MRLTFVFLFTIIVAYSCKQKVPSSSIKNASIPDNTFLVKGIGREYWCLAEVHDHRNSVLIKLYDSQTGKLIQDKRYSVICIMKGNSLWIDDLQKQIDYFDGEKFRLILLPGKDTCWLQ